MVQAFHWIIGIAIAWMVLFRFRLSLFYGTLFIFSYFLLYEYVVIARNYSLVLFFGLLLIKGLEKRSSLLLLLSSAGMALTNIYGFLLSVTFAIFLLWYEYQKRPMFDRKITVLYIVLQVLLFLLFVFLLLPPDDNCFNNLEGINPLNVFRKLPKTVALIFDALFPFQGGKEISWGYTFADKFIYDMLETFDMTEKGMRITGYYIKTILIAPVIYYIIRFFKRDKAALVFLLAGWLLIHSFQSIIHSGALRHAGFYFAFLLLAFILLPSEKRNSPPWLSLILLIQVLSAFVILISDVKMPFSNSLAAAEFLNKHFGKDQVVFVDRPPLGTPLSGYYGKPIYTTGEEGPATFVRWNNCMGLNVDIQTPAFLLEKARALQSQLKDSVVIITTYDPQKRYDDCSGACDYLSKREIARFTGALSGEDYFIFYDSW